MTWLSFIGCALIAYALPSSLIYFIILRRPQLMIVFLFGAFMYLISGLIAASLWFAAKDVYALTIAENVIVQGLCRMLAAYLYSLAETKISEKLKNQNVNFPLNWISSSLAMGIGFGTMQSVIMYGSTLKFGAGPGDYFVPSCPGVSIFFFGAVNSLLFTLMQTAFAVLTMAPFFNKKWYILAAVPVLHSLASFPLLLNREGSFQGGCFVAIMFVVVAAIGSWVLAIFLLREATAKLSQ